ncbi:MAG: DUF885 family protein [Gammaproteobacteria bacterium]
MPLPLSRLLSLAIAAALSLSLAPPAEAAKKKNAKSQTSQQARAKTAKSTRAARPKPAPAPAKVDKATRLNALYDQYWDASLKLNPLQATLQGDGRYNDQLPNFLSAAFRQQSHDFVTEWLAKVEAIGPDGLSGQDLLSYEIFVRDANNALAAEQFPSWMLPINQYYNVANVMAMLGSGTGAQPFNTVQDYDDWSRRSLGIPDLFDQAIANMREGIKAGVVQPKVLMQKVLPQLDALIKPTAEQSIFWAPVRNMPESFPAEDKARIAAEYKRMIEYRIMPAYRALRGFIATEYLPACRDTDGRGALPNGAAWYAYDVRQSTTSADMAPEQIHRIGLDEVARIQAQLQDVMKQTRARGSLQKFFKSMQEDKRFAFRSEAELLDYYRTLQSRVQASAPRLFSLVPKAGFEIKPVEPYRAQTASAVSYLPPSADGSRPGTLYVNTSDLPKRRTWEAQDQFLHEGVPGHHFQLGLQQELGHLPRFRRFGGETAFVEGWGLYSESLGKELGLYEDPYSYFGYLRNELWRAVRLVVDTGLNGKGWSWQQAIDYILDNAPATREEAEAEVERAMAIPGQALAYKIGELKMQALRDQASRELGPAFDVREFHAEVLKDGSVPLDVLQEKIGRWIASKKGGKPSS